MDTLRNELIESQKVRSDLLKWKLLIVSGLGGAALGFSGDGPTNAHFAIAVLPLACSYVDLLCRHLSLRNKAIGLFFEAGAHQEAHLRDYEKFYKKLSKNAWNSFSLESIALLWLTLLVSIAVIPIGILAGNHSWAPWSWPAGLFYGAGIIGLIASASIQIKYIKYKEKAELLSKEINTQQSAQAGPPPSSSAP